MCKVVNLAVSGVWVSLDIEVIRSITESPVEYCIPSMMIQESRACQTGILINTMVPDARIALSRELGKTALAKHPANP